MVLENKVAKQQKDTSFLYGANAPFIEELYQKFLVDNTSVSPDWQVFFKENSANSISPSWKENINRIIPKDEIPKQKLFRETPYDNNNLEALRKYGHFTTNLDPLGLEKPKKLSEFDIDENIALKTAYSDSIGVEFSHIQDTLAQSWLYERFEELQSIEFSRDEKIRMLQDLVEVEGLEQYLHKKFPGEKRFSVEGGDSSIISLVHVIEQSSKFGVEEVVVGMAHRGRLNTLTKVLGKPYQALFAEFFGKSSFPEELGIAGDVKYHMGFSNDITTNFSKKIHLSLTPNPSHLEAVNPVVAGRTRAKQDLINDSSRDKVVALLFHGDAAFCGQGVVAESLMLSTLEHYNTGGVLHVVINNQVGFTANPVDGHASSRYSTDFVKIIGAPIIHVNGDDIEAVVKATILASEYRAKYKKDAVVEIICYRKYGHNEGDEPMYTQPLMYNIIKNKQTPAAIYAEKLVSQSVIAPSDYQNKTYDFKQKLDAAYESAKTFKPEVYFLDGQWRGLTKERTEFDKNLTTGIDKSNLGKILKKLCEIPENFNLNPKLKKLFDIRQQDFEKQIVDWATAEQLAFATLLEQDIPIRLTGQDVGRGTFSHRHSVLYDQVTGVKYIPLNNLGTKATYEVADSNLSEYGVLGFEFGYSFSHPKSLVIWEAQYGDFANGAQIIFDQFISTTETKWLRLTGLVVSLPHAYEGQGSEHTSARLERILQLCAEDNMQVAYPTTPASIFHLLRRQQLRQVRKPLIIMAPKSVLRNPLATSTLDEISENTIFRPLVGDNLVSKNVKRVIICSGKLYYDLLAKRTELKLNNIALIRIEELYPFPVKELEQELEKYADVELIWCQEEPENMGAWSYFYSRVCKNLKNGGRIKLISRKEAASPATGYSSLHKKEQEELLNKALRIGE